jgi:hypothetical protein
VARARGDLEQALRLFEECFVAHRDAGNRGGVAGSLDELANLARDQDAPERAARLFAAAHGLRLAIGTSLAPVASAEHNRDVAALEADLGETAFAAAWAEG